MFFARKFALSVICFSVLCTVAAAGAIAAVALQQTEAASGQAAPKVGVTDPRVGKKLIVTEDGAPLRTPKSTVWKAYRGEVFTVSIVNGEWLWIGSKQGWHWEKQVVLFDDAIKVLTEKVTQEPTAENYDMRGIAYTAHEDYDKAVADFTESLKLKTQVPGVLNNRGRALYLKGDYAAAAKDFDVAIRVDPKHFVAMLNRANCSVATDKLDAALQDLNAAIKLNPEFPEALNNRGVCHLELGELDAAERDFNEALQLDSLYPLPHFNLAVIERVREHEAKAQHHLEASRNLGFNGGPIDQILNRVKAAYAKLEPAAGGGR